MFSSAFITGFILCATLIVAIGAQNAFVLRQGLKREHVAPIVLFCALADLILIALGVAGLGAVLGRSPVLVSVLTVSGSAFLVWYGVQALRRASGFESLRAGAELEQLPLRAALAQAAGFTLLNPHVYLDTVLLMGSIGTRQPPHLRAWFVGGAACASGAWFVSLGFGARLLAPVFANPRAWRVLDSLVGLTLLVMAVNLIRQGLAP